MKVISGLWADPPHWRWPELVPWGPLHMLHMLQGPHWAPADRGEGLPTNSSDWKSLEGTDPREGPPERHPSLSHGEIPGWRTQNTILYKVRVLTEGHNSKFGNGILKKIQINHYTPMSYNYSFKISFYTLDVWEQTITFSVVFDPCLF